MHLFSEISIVLAIGATVAIIMKALRQPLIIGHIFTGIIAGPAVFSIIHDDTAFGALGSVGVAIRTSISRSLHAWAKWYL